MGIDGRMATGDKNNGVFLFLCMYYFFVTLDVPVRGLDVQQGPTKVVQMTYERHRL